MTRHASGGEVHPQPPNDSIPAILSEGSVACVQCEWQKVGGSLAEQGIALREHMRTEHPRGR
jgi:hypothetical protein